MSVLQASFQLGVRLRTNPHSILDVVIGQVLGLLEQQLLDAVAGLDQGLANRHDPCPLGVHVGCLLYTW